MTIRELIQDDDRAQRDQIRMLLWRWGNIKDFCARRQREIAEYERLSAEIVALRARDNDLPVVNSGRIGDPTSIAAIDLIKYGNGYASRIDELKQEIKEELSLVAEIAAEVSALPWLQQRVIECRYREKLRFGEIADALFYSEDWIKAQHGKSLDAIAQHLKIDALE